MPVFYAALLDANHSGGPAGTGQTPLHDDDVLRSAELSACRCGAAHPVPLLGAARRNPYADDRALALDLAMSAACWAESAT
jgi:hypothetical protein